MLSDFKMAYCSGAFWQIRNKPIDTYNNKFWVGSPLWNMWRRGWMRAAQHSSKQCIYQSTARFYQNRDCWIGHVLFDLRCR